MKDKVMLFENDTMVMETGTRAFSIVAFGSELSEIITDARWMLLAIGVCVVADFRYGWGESSKQYKRAKDTGDKTAMLHYKWRTSRAIRRTVNKLIDYTVWVALGMTLGFAILKPLGVDYLTGGVIATAVAIACEAKSICGHFFYLHGVDIKEKTIRGFIKAFVVAFAKRKNTDIGEALEDAFDDNAKPKER